MRRIVVPLMMGGILAGFVTSFATAAVELSATLMLVQSNSDAPLAYGLYVFMQSPAGRGAGAALGVIAVVIVVLCTFLSHVLVERDQRQGRPMNEPMRSWMPPPRPRAPCAPGVSIAGVNLSYGRNHVLKDVNLEIEPGEFFAFLGPSGCGKTTLLRLIAGFNQADSGTVRIGGTDVSTTCRRGSAMSAWCSSPMRCGRT